MDFILQIGIVLSLVYLVCFILLFSSVAAESGGGATFALVVMSSIICYYNPVVLETITDNPLTVLLIVAVYLVIGVVWSIFRLRKTVKNSRYDKDNIPSVRVYKDSIIFWIAYWALDVVIYIVGPLAKDTFNYLFEKLTKLYEAVIDSALN